jgi:oligogalacturonide transporter
MDTKNKRENSSLSRLAYGLADIYGGGAFVIIGTFFTVFLTKALGMPTALAGTIPLIGKVWDAITDPLMGNICDRTQSKFGAKRFYILIGSIVSAITFVLMWIGFQTDNVMGQYFFYMLMYMLFSTGFTIVMVPYNALLPDMVEDYNVRSRFSGTRMICSTFGAILAGLIPTLVIKDNTNAASYFTVAVLFGVIFFVVILITFLGTWEKQKEPVKVGFVESFTQSLTVYKSRSYRLFIGIFLFGQAAADFVTGLAVYYIDDVLNAYGGGRFTYLMGVILISQFVGTIVFSVVMPKTSKKFPLLFGSPLRIVATIAMLFFSYEGANFTIILVLTFFIGLGMAGTSTSIYAILADMADVDELITSVNRPAVCSAMATFVRKIAQGLSSAVIGLLLAAVGYNEVIAAEGGRQAAATQSGIAYIYIFAPVILLVIAVIFAVLFPMNKKQFDVVKTEIARRKGEDTSKATAEEIAICEKVTGFKYDELWNKDNAFKFKNK